MKNQWYGKFRAKVLNVEDPKRQGRVKVSCPRVLGTAISTWCLPCIPYAVDNEGDFFVPKVGDTVWIEFEEGDVNKPIWSGGWYSENKIPISSSESIDRKRVFAYNGSRIEISSDSIDITVQGNTLSLTSSTIDTLQYLIDNAHSFRRD